MYVQELGLESAALGGSGGGSVVAGLVDELVKEGALAGRARPLRALAKHRRTVR